jgi:hypothetical protein
MEFVHIVLSFVNIGTNNGRFRESEKRVITLVRKEWRYTGRCIRSVVERKLSKRKKLDVEKFTQCMEKGGNKFRASVGSDVGWNTVFGKDVDKEKPGELDRGDMVVAGE